MTSAEKLREYQEKGGPRGAKPKVWAPPSREQLPLNAKLLAVDQSLSATGAVAMMTHGGWPVVVHAAKIAGVSEEVGNEGNLQKAESLEEEFEALLDFWEIDSSWRFIHEGVPPAKRLYRPESSLLAAYATRRIARGRRMIQLPSADPRAHALLMTGDANASKARRRREFPWITERLSLDMSDIRNEATRDGCSVALYGLITYPEVF